MRLGLIARADKTGLGIQTYEFYRHMKPDKVLAVDMSHLDPVRFKNDYNLYPEATWMRTISFPDIVSRKDASEQTMIDFLDGLDVVFTCETPYHYRLFRLAHTMGVKTVLQYNYEYLDYMRNAYTLPKPDLFLAPSLWHYDQVPFSNKQYLPVPINRDLLPFKKRTEANVFLHIAGNYMNEDRNGTRIFFEAIKYVKSDVQFRVRSLYQFGHVQGDTRLAVLPPEENYWDLYRFGDVFVMPRRFGGLCLPLNEAMSTGMPILMTDTSPQNSFLPSESLVPAGSHSYLQTRVPLTCYNVDPQELARHIDKLATIPSLVEELSNHSNEIASKWSWENLKPEYEKMLESLLQ